LDLGLVILAFVAPIAQGCLELRELCIAGHAVKGICWRLKRMLAVVAKGLSARLEAQFLKPAQKYKNRSHITQLTTKRTGSPSGLFLNCVMSDAQIFRSATFFRNITQFAAGRAHGI